MSVNINGRQYEWGDLTLILGNNDIVGFRGIKYGKKIEREVVHAKGSKGHSIQSGNETVEGEIKILQQDYDKLKKLGGGTILSLMLDGLLHYGNPKKGDKMKTDRIESLCFTEENNEWSQGDKFQEITMPFVALDYTDDI